MSVPNTFVELCATQQDKKISNVIGIVIDLLPVSQTSKGQSMLTFTLDDGTLQHGQKCRLFAKNQNDLPVINGVGDLLILRKVRFAYVGGQGLLSNTYHEVAPWVVVNAPIPKDLGIFDGGIKYKRSKNGPPVSKSEMEYVIHLGKGQDRSKFTILREDVREKLESRPKSNSCLIRDLVLESYCEIVGEVIKIFFMHNRASLYVTDYTENQMLYDFGKDKNKDYQGENSSLWAGPPGRYTLPIECWPPHSDWIKENIQPGDFVRVKKVHIKANKDNPKLIEGRLHEDKLHPDTLFVTKIDGAKEAQHAILRKEELGWATNFRGQDEEDENAKGKGKGRKRKGDEPAELSKNQKKKLKNKAKEEEKVRLKAAEEALKVVPPAPSPRTEIQEAMNSINEDIRCLRGDYEERTIPEIRDTSKTHLVKLPNGQTATMDFMEITSYATVRVVDFKPDKIENFARIVERSPNDPRQTQPTQSASSDEDSGNDSDRSATSLQNRSTQVRRRRWEWKFALLLEGACSSVSSSPAAEKDRENNQLIVYINQADAEHLLGMKAVDLRNNPMSLAQLREKLFLMWGDLEEHKHEEARRKQERQSHALEELSINTSSADSSGSSQLQRPTSRPFRCLIEEYGEQVRDQWQRRFRMKGTTIMLGNLSKDAKSISHGLESWGEVDVE